MKTILDPEVYSDILAAMEFYEDAAGPMLAADFHAEFERALKRIARQPFAFRVRESGYRRINLARFPYNIIFRITDEDVVRILAVRHDSRHPSYGIARN